MAVTTSSYSITMRLHTAPDHGIVGAVATAISQAGGIVTAIDVTESRHDRLVLDVTCSASDSDHSEKLVAAVDEVPHVEVYKVSDRTFLLHIGGKIEVTLEGAAEEPRRPVDGLHARRRPREHGALQQPRRRLAADHQGQLRRGRHRRLGRARSRQHRAGRGAAGDGGQGRAVQALRQHRRLADLPGQPGHRRDRQGRRDDRPGLRWHQPRGHRRTALLRDRGAAAGLARHPRLPRRPARHRHRRPRRAHQRAALRQEGARRRAGRRRRRRRGRLGDRVPADGRRGHRRRGVGPRGPALRRRRHAAARQGRAGRPHQPAPAARRPCATACRAPTSSSASRAPRVLEPEWIAGDGARGGRLRAGQPRPRGRPGGGREVRRRRGQRPLGLPQPDQQRAGVPRRLPRPARRARLGDHHRHAAARGGRDRARGQRRRAQRQLHHPVGLPPRRAQAGRRRDLGRSAATASRAVP